MKKNSKLMAAASILALTFSSTSLLAKVSPEESAKLGISGTELTPSGAIRAGNAEGSIPEWTGGLAQKEAIKGEWLANPFPEDKPLFSITASNY